MNAAQHNDAALGIHVMDHQVRHCCLNKKEKPRCFILKRPPIGTGTFTSQRLNPMITTTTTTAAAAAAAGTSREANVVISTAGALQASGVSDPRADPEEMPPSTSSSSSSSSSSFSPLIYTNVEWTEFVGAEEVAVKEVEGKAELGTEEVEKMEEMEEEEEEVVVEPEQVVVELDEEVKELEEKAEEVDAEEVQHPQSKKKQGACLAQVASALRSLLRRLLICGGRPMAH
ncbi:uncharacterized protein LOC142908182 [Petromyzon marinus]|uniref:uncharacterized protein LOC142908182 n=1 Tax=Petromyzon marinus TaxID=7757 RepID=UPI003F70B80C